MTTATGRVDSQYAVDWSFGVQWKPVVAAALVGFAITLILTTLGAAIGFSAANASNGADGQTVGIGAIIWWVLTVAIAGFMSGRVLGTTARRDVDYNPAIHGTLAWVIGVIILLFLLANGVGNIIGGLGGGMGAAAANGAQHNVTAADSVRAVRTATHVGTGAAWALLGSQIIGLVTTIIGAGRRERAVATTTTERERTSRL
ncbi:MAG: hypothetical protein ABR537_05620 [Gemmatimonadales bacterium]